VARLTSVGEVGFELLTNFREVIGDGRRLDVMRHEDDIKR
jgi:hypothetical protein